MRGIWRNKTKNTALHESEIKLNLQGQIGTWLMVSTKQIKVIQAISLPQRPSLSFIPVRPLLCDISKTQHENLN